MPFFASPAGIQEMMLRKKGSILCVPADLLPFKSWAPFKLLINSSVKHVIAQPAEETVYLLKMLKSFCLSGMAWRCIT